MIPQHYIAGPDDFVTTEKAMMDMGHPKWVYWPVECNHGPDQHILCAVIEGQDIPFILYVNSDGDIDSMSRDQAIKTMTRYNLERHEMFSEEVIDFVYEQLGI